MMEEIGKKEGEMVKRNWRHKEGTGCRPRDQCVRRQRHLLLADGPGPQRGPRLQFTIMTSLKVSFESIAKNAHQWMKMNFEILEIIQQENK